MRHPRRGLMLITALVASATVMACRDTAPGTTPSGAAQEGDSEPPRAAPGPRTYQRSVVFLDSASDTTMFVPWDFESRSGSDGIQRTIRGWLGRGQQWALFMEDEWNTPPSRAPWRILPRGPARIVMDAEDALVSIYYMEGLRDLNVELGATLAEWGGQRGEIYRLSEGHARLAETETDGLILDVSTARVSGQPEPAEWALLSGGSSFHLLLADPEGPGSYRAWLLDGDEEQAWPEVNVEWAETRGFERARRPVPVLWRASTADGSLTAEFEAVSSHIKALVGDGAILPTLGMFEVSGTVQIGDTETEVSGFLRHFQR